jgi:hypothetical protein
MTHRISLRPILWPLGLFGLLAGLVEAAYWAAAPKPDSGDSGNCAVLVLGYPTEADGSPHPVQRFRVETGVKVMREHSCSALVISGAAVANGHVEADAMAAIARSLGVADGETIREPLARTTWENIGCSAPSLRTGGRVFIVSDALHAQRGKRYACRQDASLCSSAVAAGAEPPPDLYWWKLPVAVYEFAAGARDVLVHQLAGGRNAPVCGAEAHAGSPQSP